MAKGKRTSITEKQQRLEPSNKKKYRFGTCAMGWLNENKHSFFYQKKIKRDYEDQLIQKITATLPPIGVIDP